MQLFSAYLNENIEFANNGEETSHETLEDIITYKINATVHYALWVHDGLHNVVLCTISDANGYRMEGVGETTELSLTDTTARKYPVRMAVKRAFDHAAIRFLKLPLKDYYALSQQGDEDVPTQNTTRQQGASLPEQPSRGAQQQQQQRPAATSNRKDATTASSNQRRSQHTEKDYAQTIVTIGRRGAKKWTVAQLAENDYESLLYIANEYPRQYPPTSDEKKQIVNACRRWIKEHGGGEARESA